MIGKIVLNYVIDSVLGAGGMGTVYLSHHQQIDRKVAIKLLNPAYTHNQNIRERFKHEALLLSQMQHPNIVGLYDYVENESGVFLIMEYVQGFTLDEYIAKKSGPIPEEQAVILMKQILEGFLYAHARGIIHRDIKPANIIVTTDKKVKILDFGIAKALEQNRSMTKTGTKMGTVMFMSPEQVKGAELDVRSDIYSLGVTLFQMLTGKEPYDEKIHSEFDVTLKIVQEPLPKMKTIYPSVSERMQSLVDKACAKNKKDRFQNTAEFMLALNKLNKATMIDSKVSENMIDSKQEINSKEVNHENIQENVKPSNNLLKIIFLCIAIAGLYNIYSMEDKGDRNSLLTLIVFVGGIVIVLKSKSVQKLDTKIKNIKINTNKELKKNHDDYILTGVASGIATYFGIDPVYIRLLFLLLALPAAIGIILYILLYFIIKTPVKNN